ncbi:MAG: 2-C-methyl-D-erythritol 4-phosphate cytidylyltransferase [Chloroflexota bacterium]|nr:2-C-methyl-D-erythritol 4-phosphate cytidylyltransferase [Chloroflexota bacterium]
MTEHDPVAAILLAAGRSQRMGGIDKVWATLGGRPLLAWPLEMLAALDAVDRIVVVSGEERREQIEALAAEFAPGRDVRWTEGGERRRDSVAAGLAAAPEAAWYLVHDAARPLASVVLSGRVLDAAREDGAAIPGLAVADTVKVVDADGQVTSTLDRSALRAVQTPQAFAGPLLRRAHAAGGDDATDDAQLVERLGEPVVVVEGEPNALKVTTSEDLDRVRSLVEQGAPRSLLDAPVPRGADHVAG